MEHKTLDPLHNTLKLPSMSLDMLDSLLANQYANNQSCVRSLANNEKPAKPLIQEALRDKALLILGKRFSSSKVAQTQVWQMILCPHLCSTTT